MASHAADRSELWEGALWPVSRGSDAINGGGVEGLVLPPPSGLHGVEDREDEHRHTHARQHAVERGEAAVWQMWWREGLSCPVLGEEGQQGGKGLGTRGLPAVGQAVASASDEGGGGGVGGGGGGGKGSRVDGEGRGGGGGDRHLGPAGGTRAVRLHRRKERKEVEECEG